MKELPTGSLLSHDGIACMLHCFSFLVVSLEQIKTVLIIRVRLIHSCCNELVINYILNGIVCLALATAALSFPSSSPRRIVVLSPPLCSY